MASFGQSFGRSFSSGFKSNFEKGQEKNQELANIKAATAVIQLSDKEAADEADSRTEANKTILGLSKASQADPKLQKALISAKINRIREGGVSILPEAEKYLSSLNGDEASIFFRKISELASGDPEFSQQKLAQILTDPDTFSQISTQVSAEVQTEMKEKEASLKGEGGSIQQVAQTAQSRKIKVLISKGNADLKRKIRAIERQQKVVNNPAVLQQPQILSSQRDKLTRLNAEARAIQSNVQSLQKEGRGEAGTLAKEGRAEQRAVTGELRREELASTRPDQLDKRLSNLVGKGIFTQQRANELQAGKAERSALGDVEFTSIGPDGIIFAKGGKVEEQIEKAGRINENKRKVIVKSEINKQKSTAAHIVRLANTINQLGDKGGASIQSVSGAVARGFNTFVKQIGGLKNLVIEDETGRKSRVNFDSSEVQALLPTSGEFAKLSSVQRSNMLRLGYMVAKMNDPGGRVTDKDFTSAMQQIGATGGDPEVMKAVLADIARDTVNTINDRTGLELEEKSDFRATLNNMNINTDLLDFDSGTFTSINRARSNTLKAKQKAKQGSAPKKITSQADFDALPSGTTYIGPDGTTSRKK